MGASLAVLTFVLFLSVDYLLQRHHQKREKAAGIVSTPALATATGAASEPVFVAGYEMREPLHYHPGHTWAQLLGPDTVAVGIDDFARRLVGSAQRFKIPAVGSWLRQGGKAFELGIDGRTARLVAPVEGEVIEVNRSLGKEPELSTSDPYGRGWLCKVRSADLAANLRNLMHGSLARRWTEDSREQLEREVTALSGSVLRDGGDLAEDFARHLDPKDWQRLVERFLLT
jgi:glycine cleavage system H protein